jgi:hypothetical protein
MEEVKIVPGLTMVIREDRTLWIVARKFGTQITYELNRYDVMSLGLELAKILQTYLEEK